MRVGTLISGLLLILAGVAFFLLNIGYGSWASLHQISKWWPIILIVIGLGLFGRGSLPRWAAYLIIFFSVGAVGTYLVLGGQTNSDYKTSTGSALNLSRQQYPQVKQGNLSIDYTGGRLLINPGAQDLLIGEFSGKQIVKSITTSDQNLKVNLSQTEHSWTPRQNNLDRWQLQISPELAWNVDINAGALDGTIDLSGVPVQELDCSLGAGNILFILGENGANSNVKIEAGASNIKLQIDNDTGVGIDLGGALNSNNLDELGWTRTGNRYTSPNYQQASSKIDCDLELSAGNLDVKMVSN